MIIAATEGFERVFEVVAEADGYMVQCRDLETGTVSPVDATLFRTAPAAIAFADMSASAERYAAAGIADDDRLMLAADLRADYERFSALRLTLRDDGVGADILAKRLTHASRGKARRLH